MASTSTSYVQMSFKYDVFLSFRGEDTRHNFVSHLYKALEQHGILTYKDDEKIEKGETIDAQLIKSIEDARFYIIVFSKNYASSSWCLDELVKIMECRKATEQTAYPVFYDVQPTEIRKQSGAVGEACHQFEGSSFVDNVGEVSKNSLSGIKKLQKQILKDIFRDQDFTVSSVSGGKNKMAQMMCRKKVLVVLDDVDSTDQLEALAGDPNWYKPGSRIIITTRDEQVLVAHRVGFINNITLLSHTEAIRLFNMYAFTKETPIQGHKELSRQVVKYAHGLPLTIKVLGSLLCGQNEPQWKDALERLKKIPLKETMKILELSYDALDDDYKELFLDVACLLKGWPKDDAVIALKSCGFFAEGALRVLEQKSLITIYEDYGQRLGMHDHIEEMGKNIVRRLYPNEPKRHSRLWNKEEIEEILASDSGTQAATQCIRQLNASSFNFEIVMKGLANMKELRFLHVAYQDRIVSKDEVSNWNLPNALRFLIWDLYPFSSLPKTFQPNNLVGLQMRNSFRMVKLWKDGEEKPFLKLRFLKFSGSRLRTLDLSVASNSETLVLEYCHNLVELYVQVTPNLKELSISSCSLEKLHMPAQSPKLTSLDLRRCSKLRTLHLGITPNLETLRVKKCTEMAELKIPAECSKLVHLKLCNLKLTTLHLGITLNLETLRLKDCSNMVQLHMPAKFPKLVELNLSNLKLTTLHLGITPNLETLRIKYCYDMVELHMPAECPKLVDIDLNNLKLTTLHLRVTPNLETRGG